MIDQKLPDVQTHATNTLQTQARGDVLCVARDLAIQAGCHRCKVDVEPPTAHTGEEAELNRMNGTYSLSHYHNNRTS